MTTTRGPPRRRSSAAWRRDRREGLRDTTRGTHRRRRRRRMQMRSRGAMRLPWTVVPTRTRASRGNHRAPMVATSSLLARTPRTRARRVKRWRDARARGHHTRRHRGRSHPRYLTRHSLARHALEPRRTADGHLRRAPNRATIRRIRHRLALQLRRCRFQRDRRRTSQDRRDRRAFAATIFEDAIVAAQHDARRAGMDVAAGELEVAPFGDDEVCDFLERARRASCFRAPSSIS
jgi:hypothetical protein